MSEHNEKWKAEEAIGGNRAAVEALRELITFPLLYSSQAQKLGLKVSCNLQSFFILIYSLLILISGFFFSLFSFSGLEVFSYMVHRAPARYHSHFYQTKVNIKEKKIDLWFYFINSVFLQCQTSLVRVVVRECGAHLTVIRLQSIFKDDVMRMKWCHIWVTFYLSFLLFISAVLDLSTCVVLAYKCALQSPFCTQSSCWRK